MYKTELLDNNNPVTKGSFIGYQNDPVNVIICGMIHLQVDLDEEYAPRTIAIEPSDFEKLCEAVEEHKRIGGENCLKESIPLPHLYFDKSS